MSKIYQLNKQEIAAAIGGGECPNQGTIVKLAMVSLILVILIPIGMQISLNLSKKNTDDAVIT